MSINALTGTLSTAIESILSRTWNHAPFSSPTHEWEFRICFRKETSASSGCQAKSTTIATVALPSSPIIAVGEMDS